MIIFFYFFNYNLKIIFIILIWIFPDISHTWEQEKKNKHQHVKNINITWDDAVGKKRKEDCSTPQTVSSPLVCVFVLPCPKVKQQ
jgi:hypothetical protein